VRIRPSVHRFVRRVNVVSLAVAALAAAAVVDAAPSSATVTTTTAVTVSPSTAPATASITLSAEVTASTGSSSPSGSLVFSDGSTVLSTKTLNHGTASVTTKAFASGTHSITARYKGSSKFAASTSAATSLVMSPAQSTTTVTSSSNPAALGTSLKFSVTVARVAPATATPSGKATLVIDGTTVKTSTLASGKVSFSSIKLATGSHVVSVTYSGDKDFATSSGSLTQGVGVAATSLTLTSSANPSPSGRAAYVAAVIKTTGTATPTGTITFTDGGTQIAVIPIGYGAVALPLASFSPGQHSLIASYSGDGNNGASISSPLIETIGQPDAAGPADLDSAAAAEWAFISSQLSNSSGSLTTTSYPIQSNWQSGSWATTAASSWTAGFYPGSLWLDAQATGDPAMLSQAASRLTSLAAQDSATNTQDTGFMFTPSFGAGLRLTGASSDAPVLLSAAASLASRYNSTVGVLPSSWHTPAGEVGIMIDQVPSTELLYWAASHGGPAADATIALNQALASARDLVRSDGSTWHFADYTTSGSRIDQTTLFGNNDTWARGQAWSIYGFTMAYGNTSDPRLLAAAEKTADWWLANVPADGVPYWDFNAAGIPNEPHDTSAAAITASALLELAYLEPDATRAATYLAAARATLQSLMTPQYSGAATQGILTDAVYNREQATQFGLATVWGDYYFEEALLRLRWFAPSGSPLAVSGTSASVDQADAPNVIDGDPTTAWTSSADGDWVQLDLPTGSAVHAVAVQLVNGANGSASLELQVSSDGSTWSTVARALSSGQVSTPETYTFASVAANYVRVVVHGGSAGLAVAIGGIAAY
jgi:hypothetical protein